MNRLPGSLAAALVLASLPFFGTAALAEGKDTVISVQTNPLVDPQPACVALQLGTGLLKAGSRVTIFATLGGVGIAHYDTVVADADDDGNTDDDAITCDTVSQLGVKQDPVPLENILLGYLDAGGEILACPLCWVVEYGNLPASAGQLYVYKDQVYITSPIPLLSKADRVIDY